MPTIRPQAGYQQMALASTADILIGGSAAGVGKTYTLLLEDVYHLNNPGFGSVTFRRTQPQIRNQGGLWDTSTAIYPHCNGTPRESFLEWYFPSGASVKFASLQHEKDVLEWQGAQIPLLKFDELTHFTKNMFWYMISRNRSTCGIKPYVRATCNPDPDSWVYELVKWWIDAETGLPIPAREGVIRYLVKWGEDYIWGDSYDEVYQLAAFYLDPLIEKSGQRAEDFIKTITFISGSIYDNRIMLDADPGYLANLTVQDEQTRLQLLDGSWAVVPSANDIFGYQEFLGIFDNLVPVDTRGRYITADIALEGSDKFVIGVWYGWELVDVLVYAKSDGPEVVQWIKEAARIHSVPMRHIVYDADGVGAFLSGYLKGAIAFHGGSPARKTKLDNGQVGTENYEHVKAQCAYRMGHRVRQDEVTVSEYAASKMYDDKMTVRQRFLYERKAWKKYKTDDRLKLAILPKKAMKVLLNGQSPDLTDMFIMREYIALDPPTSTSKTKVFRPSPKPSRF